MPPISRTRTILASALAVVAFASNSILCRMALGSGSIDPTGFTTVRLVSGAVMLLAISLISGRRREPETRGSWILGGALFTYAIAFSFAYTRLEVGTGALILFAVVQATLIIWGILKGERPGLVQWAGLALAIGGLVYLVSPGLAAPSFFGGSLMAVAGLAWGVYTVRGRSSIDPLVSTTDNFVRTVPMVLVIAAVMFRSLDISWQGLVLGIASGALASGVGYVFWYAALRGLTNTSAATVQLTVPVIAAVGGILFVGEAVSLRLVLASVLILGGVGLALAGRRKTNETD